MKGKIIKFVLSINNKLITIIFFMSGIISLSYFIPKVDEFAKELYPSLNNDFSKNLVSWVLDMEIFAEKFEWFVYIGIFLFILCCIIFIMKIKYKDKEFINKVIIGHSSMSKVQFIPDTNCEYKVEEINLIDDMRDTINNYEEIKFVICKQDKLIEEFKGSINTNYEYGYMGIAHTPLIFRMGNQIGDEITISLFHKFRTGDTKKFKEINSYANFKRIQIEHENLNGTCNELIVGLSTTFHIKLNELKILKPDNKNILIFKSEELGFDVITSKKQVEAYVQFMMSKIREIVKDKNISKIHMVLSTSAAMTFALGGAISKYHDSEVIVYHFDQNNQRRYTWGIDVFKNYNNCLVITKEA